MTKRLGKPLRLKLGLLLERSELAPPRMSTYYPAFLRNKEQEFNEVLSARQDGGARLRP